MAITQNDLIKKNEEALQFAKDLTITPTDQQLLNIRNDNTNLRNDIAILRNDIANLKKENRIISIIKAIISIGIVILLSVNLSYIVAIYNMY